MIAETLAQTDALTTGFENFNAGAGAGHLNNAALAADALADVLGRWPPASDTSEAVRAAAAQFQRSASQRLGHLKGQTETARRTAGRAEKALAELEASVETKLRELDTDVRARGDAVVASFNTATAEHAVELGAAMAAAKESASSEVAALNTLKDSQTEAFAAQIEQQSAAHRALLEKVDEASTETLAGQRGHIESLMSDLAQSRDKASEIVGIVTTTGTAGHFKIEADNQKKAADRWRKLAVLFGVLATVAAFLGLLLGDTGDLSAGHVIARAIAALALYGVAGYAGAQSAHHRSEERKARQLELVLVAFEPFIKDLPEEKRDDARERVVDRVFGSPGIDGSEPALTNAQVSILGQLLEVVRKAR
jgi:hypothetical protein